MRTEKLKLHVFKSSFSGLHLVDEEAISLVFIVLNQISNIFF